MSEPSCPNCGSNFLVVERRPDGNARCACGWSGKYELCFEASKKSECVTHHLACDCREEKFKQLEAQLKEANEIAEFYASGKHFEWLGKDDFAPENPSGEPENIECGGDDDNQFTLENGGLALAYLMKWKGEK